ncbi:MAG: L-glutamate gamma-semialdehyde dehydrogenase [Candidatus Xenobia bacterium]
MSRFGFAQVGQPYNEAVREYRPGSAEAVSLSATVQQMAGQPVEIPVVIGGRHEKTGETEEMRSPHKLSQVLGRWHKAGRAQVEKAIEAALAARHEWMNMPWDERAAIFLKAADLLAGPWRDRMNAAVMLCQSKTAHQAEIDAACEMADFWRYNAYFLTQLYQEQPTSPPGVWNRMEHRPLEGFVFAATPFNFAAIAANLPTAPALMGNTVVWKPASSTVYSAWMIMQLLEAAGLPPGVINMVPGHGSAVGDPVLASEHLAGVHFTGSTAVFQQMWQTIGNHIQRYRTYPRIVGETGGKDFVVAHGSADAQALAVALLRGAFEYQGQKCSAASRAYVPENLWPHVKEYLAAEVPHIRVGDVADFRNFMGAVIDKAAYQRISSYQEYARGAKGVEILCGGTASAEEGYFIQPTVAQVHDAEDRLMREEIFGPFLTVYVYPEREFERTLDLCNRTSPYGLTGAIFSRDRKAITMALDRLQDAAGNVYVNDKPTGAVVGQQPFGGSRASGTNDKAGSPYNLLRWSSPRVIKETFVPPHDYRYPFMGPASEAATVSRNPAKV